jgi:DNA mismatch repair ATPase MutS
MKAFLMYAGRDFDMDAALPDHAVALTEDLGLDTLFGAMSGGDEFLLEVARRAVLTSLQDAGAIAYRQHILKDCLEHAAVVRQIYDLAVDAVLGGKRIYRGIFARSPDAILRWSIEALQLFVGQLRKLRQIADEHAAGFRSEGFSELFATLARELGDDYFQAIDDHLGQLRFRGGVLLSAQLGKGNKGAGYLLRRAGQGKQSWLGRISGSDRSGYTLRISDRDESGHRDLAELRERAINLAANSLAQSTDHILSFFTMLRCELGFYICCLNVHDLLAGRQEPLCFPVPLAAGDGVGLYFRGLYDVCLSLRLTGERAVGNDARADGKTLVIITGANQGGKSTFLRSAGLAQLMMQCGMFAPAESFSGTIAAGVFTHYRREEDAAMGSGKLDEELSRMSGIADRVTPGSIVLFNESFAATNEREGSAIARQIIRALAESGVRVFLVTHFFDLAYSLFAQGSATTLFLRAERRADGQRTFRLIEGEPLPTSYGQDLYDRIFGAVPAAGGAKRVRGRR